MQHGYPRPQLRRDWWQSLDGAWDFAIDDEDRWRSPEAVGWSATITVPFAPETPASGIGDTGMYRAVWYRRAFDAPVLSAGERLILHFGAVDHEATVWVNGHRAAHHAGGYTPFSAGITEMLVEGSQTIVVRAQDDPEDLEKPRGKQDWLPEAHSIWYPRTTGIWQTVWIERVPAMAIGSVRWTADVARWEIGLDVRIEGERREGLRLRVELLTPHGVIADDTYSVTDGEVSRRIALPDPGIGDARAALLWSPGRPALIEATLRLIDGDGNVLDCVESYTAMRSVGIEGDRFTLNGRPYRLRMALDQGYWPESGLTAPDDDAYRRDVELAKAMGFNGVRKHQKIESPRFLYWADRLGLLVWEEMPSAYRFSTRAVERLTREWVAAIERDRIHPCIVAWVPFNESWGVPDVASVEQQRDYVRAIYALTKTLDPTRPVIGNDGWEHIAGDIIGVHDYDHDPPRIAERYGDRDVKPQRHSLHGDSSKGTEDRLGERGARTAAVLGRERPGGRALFAGHAQYDGQPVMLTEFGGIALSKDAGATWGYSRASSGDDLAERYGRLLASVRAIGMMSGFCYTQFTDTYQETNGLLYFDRTPKFPLDDIARITRGL